MTPQQPHADQPARGLGRGLMMPPLIRAFVGRRRRGRTSPRPSHHSSLGPVGLLEGRRLLTTLPGAMGPALFVSSLPVDLARLPSAPGTGGPDRNAPGSMLDFRGPRFDGSGPALDAMGPGNAWNPMLSPGSFASSSAVRPDIIAIPAGSAVQPDTVGAQAAMGDAAGLGTDAGSLASASSSPGPEPDSSPGGHASMAAASVQIDGSWTMEGALADPQTGTVTVMAGGRTLFEMNGLDRPSSVELADLDGDGIADLIVAESGDDRILVFRGLAGGGFGAERNGAAGFAVGSDPVGVTVGDLNGDGIPDLLVADKASNDVSVLLGHGSGANWTLVRSADIAAGIAPVRTILVRADQGQDQGEGERTDAPYLLICNSGSNNVFVYKPTSQGQVGAQPSQVVDVGDSPQEMFVGPFGPHHGMDLVTLNSGTNDLTFVANVLGPHPVRQAIATLGGGTLLSAVPVTVGASGTTDLMVASSDGRLAILQAGTSGVQLTNLVAPSGLGAITAIAAGESSDGEVDLFEALDGDTMAQVRFDASGLSLLDADPTSPAAASASGADEALTWQLMPTGSGTLLDLVGVLWSGSAGATVAETTDPARLGTTSPIVVNQASGVHGSGSEADADTGEVHLSGSSSPDDDLAALDPADGWSRYVLGLDAAFESFHAEVAAVAPGESGGRGGFDRDDRPGADSAHRLVVRYHADGDDPFDDGAPWPEAVVPPRSAGASEENSGGAAIAGRRRIVGLPPGGDEGVKAGGPQELATAAVGSVVAVRLLINVTPPKPPRTRPDRVSGRFGAWPEAIPPADPHG